MLLLVLAATIVQDPRAAFPDAGRLVAGANHTCALTREDRVMCWGDNHLGQVGDGTKTDAPLPVMVPGLVRPVELAAGDRHTCARQVDGAVLCWGRQESGELGDGVKFSGDLAEEFARMRAGTTLSRATPAPVQGLGPAEAIFAGGETTCAKSQGGLWCWGKLPGEAEPVAAPRSMAEFAGASEVVMGRDYLCALIGGEVLCRSQDATGGAATLEKIEGVRDGWSLTGGWSYACVVHDGGRVRCVGDLAYAFERARGGGYRWMNATDIAELRDVARLMPASRGRHACGVRRGGEVRCWGVSESAQLGHGLFQPWRRPVAVLGLRAPRALAAGASHTCAVTTEQEVLCWGSNSRGQLGAPLPAVSVPELTKGRGEKDPVAEQIRRAIGASAAPVRALGLAPEPRVVSDVPMAVSK